MLREDLWETKHTAIWLDNEVKHGGRAVGSRFLVWKVWKTWSKELNSLHQNCGYEEKEYSIVVIQKKSLPKVIISQVIATRDLKVVSILDLPEECLVIVFKSLTAYELSSVSRVCKRFYHVCCNPTLWTSIDLFFQDFWSVLFGERVPNAKMRMSFAFLVLSAKESCIDWD